MEIRLNVDDLSTEQLRFLVKLLSEQKQKVVTKVAMTKKGTPTKKVFWTKTEIATVKKELENGNTIAKIAKLLGTNRQRVENMAYRLKHPKHQTNAIKEVLAGDY